MTKKHKDEEVKSSLEIAMGKTAEHAHEKKEAEVKKAAVPQGELEELRERASRADGYYDRMLRIAAELENYKKRAERERLDLLRYGQEELICELLPVLDNFERALAFVKSAKDIKSVMDGVNLIKKQLEDVLKRRGVEAIDAVGKQFNPDLHEALSQVETDEYPDNTVMDEHLKGYTLNKRLLRPSAVTVSRSSKEPEPAEEEKNRHARHG